MHKQSVHRRERCMEEKLKNDANYLLPLRTKQLATKMINIEK